MTYETFKYQVRKLGLNFCVLDTLICVQDDKRNALYSVDTTKQYIVCHTKRFSKLDDTTRKAVFTLVYLLAKTNINDRGDLYKETKWYLRHRYLNTYNGAGYLCQSSKTLSLRGKTDDIIPKCKFTEYEIEELGKIINLNDFEMEKVE